jgi:hypothetical protein
MGEQVQERYGFLTRSPSSDYALQSIPVNKSAEEYARVFPRRQPENAFAESLQEFHPFAPYLHRFAERMG